MRVAQDCHKIAMALFVASLDIRTQMKADVSFTKMPEVTGAHHSWRHLQLTVKSGKDNLSYWQTKAWIIVFVWRENKTANVVVMITAFPRRCKRIITWLKRVLWLCICDTFSEQCQSCRLHPTQTEHHATFLQLEWQLAMRLSTLIFTSSSTRHREKICRK